MKLVNGKIDLSEWWLNALEPTHKLILSVVSEALLYCFEHGKISMRMPAEWGDSDGGRNKQPDDPTTLYLSVRDISDDEYLGHTAEFQTSLREILKDSIDDCARYGGFKNGLANIRDGLRDLADKIDEALPSEGPGTDA